MTVMGKVFIVAGIIATVIFTVFMATLIPILTPIEAYDPGDDATVGDISFVMPDGYHGFSVEADIGNIEHYESDPIHNHIIASSSRFITTGDPLVKDVYEELGKWLVGCTDTEKAEALQSFVNSNIAYLSDDEHQGTMEYIQYPAQTLYYGKGDCEDTAILLYTLYEMAGLDATLILMPGHMSVGVVCDRLGSTVTNLLTGKTYTLADPKTDVLGESPTDGIAIAFSPTGMGMPIFAFLTLIIGILALVVIFQTIGERLDRKPDDNDD